MARVGSLVRHDTRLVGVRCGQRLVTRNLHQPNIGFGSHIRKVDRAVVMRESGTADVHVLISYGENLAILSRLVV